LLLDSTLPLIRGRTAALSQELAQGQRLEAQAVAARAELVQSREALATRRRQFAQLEGRALAAAASAQGQALGTGDVALAAGENVEALSASQASGRSALAVASEIAAVDPAPARPAPREGSAFRPPLDYRLPAVAPVEEGLGEVNSSGVRSRGLSLRTARGMALTVPASGVVRFSGPYRQHDGVVIIDHGNGWMSLIVGVSSPLKAGARVRVGEPLGRALGPLQVELSQNGRRISPALIAGSSQTVSNVPKAG
jgi:murein DD-endopeptidase MepM/ murein hydrolase activator NlpD